MLLALGWTAKPPLLGRHRNDRSEIDRLHWLARKIREVEQPQNPVERTIKHYAVLTQLDVEHDFSRRVECDATERKLDLRLGLRLRCNEIARGKRRGIATECGNGTGTLFSR